MGALENYQRSRRQPAPAKENGGGLVLLAIVLVALLIGFNSGWFNRGGGRGDDQHHEQVQPVNGGTLVFVSEKQAPPVDEDMVVRKMPDFVSAHGLDGYLWLDDDEQASEKLREFAQGKGISPPLMAYVKDKKIKRVAKWAATGEAEVEKFLK